MGKRETDWLTTFNDTVYKPGQQAGHYESYFLRANHPVRPLAFWIRYTIFSPQGQPGKAIGELWAVWFDGEKNINAAAKTEVPIGQCSFGAPVPNVKIGSATLDRGSLKGSASAGGHAVSWDLSYGGGSKPLFMFPLKMYSASFPKAKTLVAQPMAVFTGSITVDGCENGIDHWAGSQNHNWGSRHTDLYAWGQVAGFDNSPNSFLEVATARVKIGPLWTPSMTPLVLRHGGREYALNSLTQTLNAHGQFRYFDWHFGSADAEVAVAGRMHADRSHVVGLNYYNPPGGDKHCLNSKLASCELRLTHLNGEKKGSSELLTTAHRAAFEILTDKRDHDIEIRV